MAEIIWKTSGHYQFKEELGNQAPLLTGDSQSGDTPAWSSREPREHA